MAPISEKRTSSSQKQQQQPSDVVVFQTTPDVVVAVLKEGSGALSHHHHNHNHHQHAKENVTKVRKNGVVAPSPNAKGLEILDFHESWLEEMEMYKDMMHVKKHVPHQLLGSHNHAHTPQGCQIEMVNTHHHHHQHQHHHSSANKMSSHPTTTTSAATNPTKGRTSGGGISNNVANGTTKKRNVNDNKITRVRAANADAIAAKEVRSDMTTNGNQRPREKTPTKTAAGGTTTASSSHHHHHNAKRSGHSSSHSAAIVSKPPNTTGPAAQKSPTRATTKVPININAASTANNSTKSAPVSASTFAFPPVTTKNANAKIIVNQFHASSLLNGHHLEEKEKILTLNGLANNTSATAYEASFYAANYLNTTDARNNHNNSNGINGITHPSAKEDSSNYIGVSLANAGVKTGVHEEQADDDDPSSAIDIVVTDTDSDYDEEYAGEPFRLKEDGDETLQSKTKPYVYYTPQSILSPSLFPNVPPYLNYSSHVDPGPSIPPQLRKVLKWKLSPAMPKIVKRVVLNSGFRIIKNTTDWMAVWERHMKSPGFRTIRSHQKYNHMPGSFRIGRKDSMWRSIYENVRKFGKKEFGFMQRSYIMPDELEQLRKAWPKNAARRTKWIVKPPASARGTGISIVNKWSQFPKDVPLVVQKYIERPLLINDNKFDMRIYVVLTSINPLRLYMYKDGLARFASVKYSSELNSLDERCMHLTNYSINKFSENYAKNEDVNACQGHKWTLQSLWSCLEERGVNTKRLWATLRNLVIKALISGEAGLNRMYRQNVNFRYNCFELFGFDVLLDENLVPWLLEINISPSLHSELPLDLHVKGPLIQAVLNTAMYQVPPKLSEKQQKDILEELKLKGPLCHDKRIFTTCLRNEEIRKHNQFTNRSIEMREDYLDAILDKLQPDDVRCLMVSEDELNRSSPLERIFPTSQTYPYLRFVDNPRYYNRLLDAWEYRYGHCREKGIELLSKYSEDNYHVIVSDAALEKEPSGPLTEIDVLHVKKEDPNADDDPNATKIPSAIPEKTLSDIGMVKDATTGPPSLQPPNATATTNAVAASNEVKLKDSPNTANESKTDRTHTSHINAKHNKTKSHDTTTADRKLKTDIKAS